MPAFHTIRVEPYVPAPGIKLLARGDRIAVAVLDHVTQNPGTSRNALEKIAGKGKGKPFNATRQEVRDAVDGLMQDGRIRSRPPTAAEQRRYRLPHQVKQILEACEAEMLGAEGSQPDGGQQLHGDD